MTTVTETRVMVNPNARVVPWRKVGTVVTDKIMTADKAIKLGGLDWALDKTPLFTTFDGKKVPVPDRFAVVRTDTADVLGVVSADYVLFSNREAFQFCDSLVDSGEAKYDSVGSLRNGRWVWLTAKLPTGVMVGGVDPIDLYLLLHTSHDGSKAITAGVTPVRIGCTNTLNIAMVKAVRRWTVRHTSTMQGRLAEARQALDLTFAYVEEFEAEANRMLSTPMTVGKFEKVARAITKDKDRATQALIEAFTGSPTLKGIEGTAWAALNAVGEVYEWGRPQTSDVGRLRTTLEGTASRMRERAYALLRA